MAGKDRTRFSLDLWRCCGPTVLGAHTVAFIAQLIDLPAKAEVTQGGSTIWKMSYGNVGLSRISKVKRRMDLFFPRVLPKSKFV